MWRVLFGLFASAAALWPAGVQAQPPAATLDARDFAAIAPAETLLHVSAPGRFAVAASSAGGTALDLVDMITGPTPQAGTPGGADGRLDLLLDSGTYKLRLHPAAHAQGRMQLRVLAFSDAAAPALMPHDAEADATLADLQQRSYWFEVGDSAKLRLEAAGRALADFRLWRNGRDLVAIAPLTRIIDPTHGHPLRDMQIAGNLPPGTYLATAYGGPPLPWSDGSTAQPLYIREGAADTLRQGWAGGRIGPFGTALFRAAGGDDLFRLSMEGPATLDVDGAQADIDRNSRVPQAELRASHQGNDHIVEVTAAEGAAFQLRATSIGKATSIASPGDYFMTANTTGLGGDDVPATLVLARSTPQGWSVAASNAPEIGAHAGWHHRFSLGGEVSLLFHMIEAGRLAANVTGIRIGALELTALDAMATHPPVSPQAPGVWDVEAGWYALTLAPVRDSKGVADVTLAPPGLAVALAPPAPPAPSVTFGVQSLAWRETLRLFGNASPDAAFGLDARAAPVVLSDAPLRVSQEAGVALSVPLRQEEGRLTAVEYGAGNVAVQYDAGSGIASLPAADHARMVALAWAKPPAETAMPVAEAEAARPVLHDGAARFFDLAENAQSSFALEIGTGGLFRVETLGRLRTRGAIGSRFVPELASAAANGIGQNLLLQGFLRAGHYHVDVTAEASGGHAGILASPAPLLTTPKLLEGGSVRATLQAGTALLVPVHIGQAGRYRIELLGIGRTFSARLEDPQGWPFAATAPFGSVVQELAAGDYRLLVSPEPTAARALARLSRIEPVVALAGHGPHPLPFDAPQRFTWREPAGRNDPRPADEWRFSLAAPADVTLSISDGMQARIRASDGRQEAHLAGGTPFTGRLGAGEYRVQASSQGRNDRLDYTLGLQAAQLQPGVPRAVSLPATLAFALASDRVVSLTSFGAEPVRGVLKDAAGGVLARIGPRENDWNLALSRPLPAGAYTLELASAAPPPQHATPPNVNDRPAPPGDGEEPADGQQAAPEAAMEAPPDGTAGDAEASGPGTELTLSLPPDLPPQALQEAATLSGGGVHHLGLPQPQAGQLVLAGAASAAELVVSLEQRAGASWHSRAVAQGLAPIVALPADGGAGAWRLSVWAVDGGSLPIQVAARIETGRAVAGQPRLSPAPLPGVADGLVAAHVALNSQAVLTVADAGVLAGAWPGHAATRPEAGLVLPQAGDLWLVARQASPLTLTRLAQGSALAMTLPEAGRATLPPAAARLTAWIAEAQGQPGIGGGHGMGVAGGSALALAGREAPTLWNAGGAEALRVSVRPVPLTEATASAGPSQTVPARGAVAVTLPEGLHSLHLDLPPGTAAVAGWPDAHGATVWAGSEAVSRTLQGDWRTLLLVNTTAAPSTAGLQIDALARAASLRPDHAERRFFGAAGSIDMAVTAAPAQTLVVAGDSDAVFIGDDGSVRRGRRIALTGNGRVTLNHGAGLVAAWLEGAGTSPWPAPRPVQADLPASLVLSGPAMQLALAAPAPALLRIRSSAPVILVLNGGEPVICPAAAAESRYLPAGPASLRIIAPQDGDLTGSIDLTTAPLREAGEGLGEAVTVAPGDAALFGFTLAKPARIGMALRAQPDDAALTLLDAAGHRLGEGASMLRDLPAGRYVLWAQVPQGAPPTLIRPAILGIAPRPNGPPPETIRFYRELAGLASPRDGTP